jgi:hypothetical protein
MRGTHPPATEPGPPPSTPLALCGSPRPPLTAHAPELSPPPLVLPPLGPIQVENRNRGLAPPPFRPLWPSSPHSRVAYRRRHCRAWLELAIPALQLQTTYRSHFPYVSFAKEGTSPSAPLFGAQTSPQRRSSSSPEVAAVPEPPHRAPCYLRSLLVREKCRGELALIPSLSQCLH